MQFCSIILPSVGFQNKGDLPIHSPFPHYPNRVEIRENLCKTVRLDRYGLKVNNLTSLQIQQLYNRQAMAYLDYLLASELFWSENLVLLEIATAIHVVLVHLYTS